MKKRIHLRPVFISVFLIGINMLLSMNDCNASDHSILAKYRYDLRLKVVFSDTTSRAKIIKRMCRHYDLHISYGSGKRIYLADKFHHLKRICWYTYTVRIKITDVFNSDFKISEFRIKKRDHIKPTYFEEVLL